MFNRFNFLYFLLKNGWNLNLTWWSRTTIAPRRVWMWLWGDIVIIHLVKNIIRRWLWWSKMTWWESRLYSFTLALEHSAWISSFWGTNHVITWKMHLVDWVWIMAHWSNSWVVVLHWPPLQMIRTIVIHDIWKKEKTIL